MLELSQLSSNLTSVGVNTQPRTPPEAVTPRGIDEVNESQQGTPTIWGTPNNWAFIGLGDDNLDTTVEINAESIFTEEAQHENPCIVCMDQAITHMILPCEHA